MILSKLAGVTLLISVNTGSSIAPEAAVRPMSSPQKTAAIQALMRAATECIANAVAAHPRFRKQAPNDDLGDLIVASVPNCVVSVRAMIDAYDRFFGDGSGEAFFMGPYLDTLPAAVSTRAVERAD